MSFSVRMIVRHRSYQNDNRSMRRSGVLADQLGPVIDPNVHVLFQIVHIVGFESAGGVEDDTGEIEHGHCRRPERHAKDVRAGRAQDVDHL
jgi:hypothetical protein